MTQIKATIYGSMATGFALDSSDVDICLSGLPISTKQQLKEYMDILTINLLSQPFASKCQFIQTARVPVIKIVNLHLKCYCRLSI